MIRALVVDDEIHAREELQALLQETGEIAVVGSCANAVEAIRVVQRERPEVLFLDIQMPVLSGFELLGMIDPECMPKVVFVTAFDDYAVRAFEEKALDYLLKPVARERLRKTLDKLQAELPKESPALLDLPPIKRIPCLRGNRIKLVDVAETELVRSDVSGVHVLTARDEFFTELTLKVLAARSELVKCHKQFLINPGQVDEIVLLENGLAEIRTCSGRTVPVSRRYLKSLKERWL